MPRPKIGAYKKYLLDINIPVPRSTAWLQRRMNNENHVQVPIAQGEVVQPVHPVEVVALEPDLGAAIQVNDQPHHPGHENMEDSDSNESVHVNDQPHHPVQDDREGSELDETSELNDQLHNLVEEHLQEHVQDTVMDQDSSGSLTDYLSSSDDDEETRNNDQQETIDERTQINLHPEDHYGSSGASDNDGHNLDEDLGEDANVDEYPLIHHPDFNDHEVAPNVEVAGPHRIEQEHRQVLYNGCNRTSAQSDLLIMSFVIRWGLQDTGIEDLLKLIDCHMPYPALGSKYMFLKKFPNSDQFVTFRYFCPECSDLLELDSEANEERCEKCGYMCVKEELKQEESYFLQLSIAEQIKQTLSNDKVTKHLRKDCEEADVVKGWVYQNLRMEGVIGDDDLTLQWNFDGLQPFKSAKCSVVPIQAEINELPYSIRRDNMILCGLYCGKKNPPVNSFLKLFVEELQQLHFEGLLLDLPGVDRPKVVKVHTLLASVDSIARPVLQGLKQFNGRYGCCFCLRRGTRIARGRGETRVYIGREGEPRTIQHNTSKS